MKFSLHQRLKSFGFAGQGIKDFLSSQHNAWIQVCISVLTIVAAAILHLSATEWCLVFICMGGVLGFEAVNSSIEQLADTLHPEKNEGIRKVKDMAAGAVLLVSCFAVIIGLIIFVPKIIKLFF